MPLITLFRLRRLCPRGRLELFRPIVDCSAVIEKFEIGTPLRISHFLGQCAVETDYFRTMFEYGNRHPFKGRGYIQLTGRSNYKIYGDLVRLNLVSEPNRAAEPDLAVRIASLFWNQNRLNRFADRDDAQKVGRAINRGDPYDDEEANNERERIDYSGKAKDIFVESPDQFSRGDSGPLVSALRRDLRLIGYNRV